MPFQAFLPKTNVHYNLRPVLLQQFLSASVVTDVITDELHRHNLKISVKKLLKFQLLE